MGRDCKACLAFFLRGTVCQCCFFFFFQAEDGIRDWSVTGVQTCALPICQTPLKLSRALEDAGAPIIGTSPDSIDIAEDRERFQALVKKLGLKQPANATARDRKSVV